MSHRIEVSQAHSESERIKVTPRTKKLAVAAAALAAFGASEIASPTAVHGNQETQLNRIIESPANIPEGHIIELPSIDNLGADAMAKKYAADGHYDDLKHEIENEYVDGNLPNGYAPAFDRFVDPQYVEQFEEHQ